MTRYRSRVDTWVLMVLAVAILGQVVALVTVLVQESPPGVTAAVAIAASIGILLIVWIMVRTHYTVAGGRIRIVCGPFRWTIPLDEITDVTPSRNLLSSPALSLDRLKIRYGKNRFVLVSPENRKSFLRAIVPQDGPPR